MKSQIRNTFIVFVLLLEIQTLPAAPELPKPADQIDFPTFKGSSPFELFMLTGGRSGKLISDRIAANDPAEVSGAEMFLGVQLKGRANAEEAGRFFYNLDASVIALAREGSKNGNERNPFSILPGDELNAGIAFCPQTSCGLSVGRSPLYTPGKFEANNHISTLAGGHGTQTGVSLFFRGQNVSFNAVPILLPGYSGRTWSENGLPGNNWKSGTQDARGFHAEGVAMLDYFGISLHYSGINQRQTSRITGNSRDRIEYSGMAMLVRKPEGFVRSGFSLGLERASGRYLAMDRDETGSSMVTIDGMALSSAFDLKIQNFSWQTNFLLPEPQTQPRGSRKSSETAGYVGYGASIVDSPALGDLLSAKPFPVLCPGEECAGLDRSNSPAHFRNQAGVLRTRTSYQWGRFHGSIGGILFRPLAGRSDESGNPFQRIRKATNVPEFREAEIVLSYEFSSGKAIVSYGRLWVKTTEKSSYGGESIQIALTRSL
ncbi:MAG: hypothetical protein K8S54_20810 [Spirochaetia bacterium]|nr:hypothetical protein [Spirochaetia bacterium]